MRDLIFSQIVRSSTANENREQAKVSEQPKLPYHRNHGSFETIESNDEVLRIMQTTKDYDDLLAGDRSPGDSGELHHQNSSSEVRLNGGTGNSNEWHQNCTDDVGLNGKSAVELISIHPNTQSSAESLPACSAPRLSDFSVSFLIIIFFYFQDAQLLHIKTAFTSTDSGHKAMFRELLAGLFQFRVEVFQFMDTFCFVVDMTPLMKIFNRALMVPCVLVQFGIVYLVHRCCNIRKKRPSDSSAPEPSSYSVKLATGFVLALLFTYQQLAATSFTLLNCVPIGDRLVLFVQGTIDCYQTWQFGVMAYAGLCIVPFCLVLLIGPGLLKDGLIGLIEFFIACIIPFPFLLRWVFIRVRAHFSKRTPLNDAKSLSHETKTVIQVLQGHLRISIAGYTFFFSSVLTF